MSSTRSINTVMNIISMLISAFCSCIPNLSGMVGFKCRREKLYNVKHVVGDAGSITIGGVVSAKFNSRRYKVSAIKLLG